MIFIIPNLIVESYIKRLTNQLWKLIPMRENNENWLGQLESLILEIAGFGSLASEDEKLVILLTKLEGLRVRETDFSLYRKTVFESISLLKELRL